jgi:ABC-type bacteriocin/lantibiotic exporter with double-glycine peptidase domain
VTLLTEIFTGIRAVKLLVWHENFANHLQKLREIEFTDVRRVKIIHAILGLFWGTLTLIATGVALICHILMKSDVESEMGVGASLNILVVMVQIGRLVQPINDVSEFHANLLENSVAHERLSTFWSSSAGFQGENVLKSSKLAKNCAVSLQNAVELTFQRRNSKNFTLNVGAFTLNYGEVAIVKGTTASGKSMFLKSFIWGDLAASAKASATELCACGDMVYVGQSPVVFAGNLADNVTFGEPFDEKRFNDVLNVCMLRSELCGASHSANTTVCQCSCE